MQHNCCMKPPDPAGEIRAWMIRVMDETGWNPPEWADKAGLAATTIQRAIKPGYAYVTSSKTLAKLAAAAHTAPPALQDGPRRAAAPNFLPVRYRVQAGYWLEVDDYVHDYHAPPQPVMADPRYAGCAQWLEEVVGDSVNLKIPAGGFAHVVDAIDMGYAPRREDFVVVERRRAGGQLRERTIKQIEIRDGVVELWPRSSNEKWNSPVILTDGVSADEDIEVVIAGLVVGAYLGF